MRNTTEHGNCLPIRKYQLCLDRSPSWAITTLKTGGTTSSPLNPLFACLVYQLDTALFQSGDDYQGIRALASVRLEAPETLNQRAGISGRSRGAFEWWVCPREPVVGATILPYPGRFTLKLPLATNHIYHQQSPLQITSLKPTWVFSRHNTPAKQGFELDRGHRK